MTPEEKIVYFQGQIACAQIEAMAMVAENERRKHIGEAPSFTASDFLDIITKKYPIHHNAMLGEFYP